VQSKFQAGHRLVSFGDSQRSFVLLLVGSVVRTVLQFQRGIGLPTSMDLNIDTDCRWTDEVFKYSFAFLRVEDTIERQ
jgi:hypothetical protein